MNETLAQAANQAASSATDFTPVWILAVIAIGSLLFGIGKWVGGVNKDRSNITKLAKDIRKDVKKILRALQPVAAIAKGSPLQLTEFGKKIAEHIQAASIVHDLAEYVALDVTGKDEYEIQEWCFDYMSDHFEPSESIDALIRKYAYDNGIDRDQIMDVLAVMLRDRLISAQTKKTTT